MRLLFHTYTFHAYTSTCVLPRDVYFHAFTSTRRVFPRVYFHETCTLYDMSKCGPRKHVKGMHCSIVMVPHKITRGKMKLQLSIYVCNTFMPKIKEIHRVTYLMSPLFEGYITCTPHNMKFISASIFIMKDRSFDCGIYLITTIE